MHVGVDEVAVVGEHVAEGKHRRLPDDGHTAHLAVRSGYPVPRNAVGSPPQRLHRLVDEVADLAEDVGVGDVDGP